MKRTSRLMMAVGMVLCLSSLPVFAQADSEAQDAATTKRAAAGNADGPAATSDADVRGELEALKKEIQAMRSDMRGLLREIQLMKQAQARAAKPAARQRPRRPAMNLLGKPAPVASFKTVNNEDKTLGGESEKVKVAIFYASWCGFCKRALPGFEKLKKDYADKDVEIMAISLDSKSGQRAKTEADLVKHLESLKVDVPMHWDPDKKIGGPYKVSSFPTSFVIGKNGVVEAVHVGGPADLDKQIAGEIDKLLAGESLVAAAKKS